MEHYATRYWDGKEWADDPDDCTIRVRWYCDTDYQTRGSYAYDTEEETKKAEDDEIAKLESGEYVALGMIPEERCKCDCPECSGWHRMDGDCWGIVTYNSENSIDEYAEWVLCLTDIHPRGMALE